MSKELSSASNTWNRSSRRLPTEERHATRQRLVRLRHWLEKGEKMLPWALKFLVK